MKKVLLGLVIVVVVLVGAGYAWYQSAYGGQSYYVKIVTDGNKKTEKADNGKDNIDTWYYKQGAYNKQGEEKNVTFTADHNLKQEAYLDLTVSANKGVTTWKEVQETEVPKKALEKLN